MGIVTFIILAVVLGLLVWAVWSYTPIPMPIKKLLLWAVVIVLVVILCKALGVFGHDVQIPTIR